MAKSFNRLFAKNCRLSDMAFDIIVGLILAGYIIHGLRKGFFHEVMGLVGVIGGVLAGIIGAGSLSKYVSNALPDFFAKEIVALILCFTILFIIFYVICRYLARFLKSLTEKVYLEWLNNFLGGILGGLKGAFILSLVLMFLSFLPIQKTLAKYEKDSVLHKPLYYLVPKIYKFLGSPDELPEPVRDAIEKSRDQFLDDAMKDLKKDIKDAID